MTGECLAVSICLGGMCPVWGGIPIDSKGFRMAAAVARAYSHGSSVAQTAGEDADVTRLGQIVRDFSFGRKEVMLSSGVSSGFYFDMKPSMLNPEGASLIAKLIFEQCRAVEAELVGGLEMGAVPITGAVCQYSFGTGHPIDGFFVRKKAKEHGAQKLVEGLAPGVSVRGKRVVIVDDVTTTGKSALQVVTALRAEGANVVLAISIVDREEGAVENFRAEGITLVPLLTASRFLNDQA